MKIIGITGGVGAGKSTVLDYLQQRHGAYTVQADQVGHELMEQAGSCFEPMVQLLGREILDGQGSIDRGKVAKLVFPRPELLRQLNGIIHPAVRREIGKRMATQESQGRKIFVMEAALLLEAHYDECCGDLWYIYAEDAIRRHRLKQQRGYSEEKITDILKNQQPDRVFRERCDYVVENNGDLQTTFLQIDKRIEAYGLM